MKKQKILTPAKRSTFALALWSPARSAEQTKMRERCEEIKEQKRKMKADIKSQVAELARYVARMKRAPEEKRLSLMNAFLTHMEERRIAMDERQARMQEEITKHMILHMQIGKESMLQCQVIWGLDDSIAGVRLEEQDRK